MEEAVVRTWRMSDGSVYQAYLRAHQGPVTGVQFIDSDTSLVSSSEDKTLIFWLVKSATRIFSHESEKAIIQYMQVSPDGIRIAYVSDKRRLVLLINRTTMKTVSTAVQPMVNPVFSPDGLLLAASTDDNQIRLWNSLSYNVIATFPVVEGISLQALAFSPNGYLIAAGDANGNILLYGLPK
jgi:WD40 repeat protein